MLSGFTFSSREESQTSNLHLGRSKSKQVLTMGTRTCFLRWRPSLLGWRSSLLGWRSSLLGWRPSLLGWRPSLLGGGHRSYQDSQVHGFCFWGLLTWSVSANHFSECFRPGCTRPSTFGTHRPLGIGHYNSSPRKQMDPATVCCQFGTVILL